jgi:hypothetical protein
MVRQMPQALLRCTIQVSPVYCMKPRCVNNKQVWQHRTSRHVNRWVGGSNRSCLKMASMLFHGRFHGKRHHSQHQNHRSHHRTPLSCGRACKHTSGERASERACVRVCVSACVLPSVRDVACCAVRVLAHLRARMHARRHKGAQTCAFETREREGGGQASARRGRESARTSAQGADGTECGERDTRWEWPLEGGVEIRIFTLHDSARHTVCRLCVPGIPWRCVASSEFSCSVIEAHRHWDARASARTSAPGAHARSAGERLLAAAGAVSERASERACVRACVRQFIRPSVRQSVRP